VCAAFKQRWCVVRNGSLHYHENDKVNTSFYFSFSQRCTTVIKTERSALSEHHNRFTALFQDHPGEPVPEENFWTL